MFEDEPLIEYTWEDALNLAKTIYGGDALYNKRVITRMQLYPNDPNGLIGSLCNLDAYKIGENTGRFTKRHFIYYVPYDEIPLYVNEVPDLVKWRLNINK